MCKSHLVGRPQLAHPRTLPECWLLLAVVQGNLQAQALVMSGRSVGRILHSDLNLHAYKLRIVYSLSDRDKEVRLQFCCYYQGILTENPDLPSTLLMSDESHFHLHGTINKQDF